MWFSGYATLYKMNGLDVSLLAQAECGIAPVTWELQEYGQTSEANGGVIESGAQF